MSVVVIGTVGIDDIQTPHGGVNAVLGGSATYASLAASHFAPTHSVERGRPATSRRTFAICSRAAPSISAAWRSWKARPSAGAAVTART